MGAALAKCLGAEPSPPYVVFTICPCDGQPHDFSNGKEFCEAGGVGFAASSLCQKCGQTKQQADLLAYECQHDNHAWAEEPGETPPAPMAVATPVPVALAVTTQLPPAKAIVTATAEPMMPRGSTHANRLRESVAVPVSQTPTAKAVLGLQELRKVGPAAPGMPPPPPPPSRSASGHVPAPPPPSRCASGHVPAPPPPSRSASEAKAAPVGVAVYPVRWHMGIEKCKHCGMRRRINARGAYEYDDFYMHSGGFMMGMDACAAFGVMGAAEAAYSHPMYMHSPCLGPTLDWTPDDCFDADFQLE